MKFVLIAGSNRNTSASTRLAEYMEGLILQKGHNALLFDLYRTPLPFYSPDESYGEHADLSRLKQTLLESHAVILATPEYHSGLSGVLKNALDHLGKEHFRGKAVLSMSSSGGAVGVSSLQQMQAIVRNLHGINAPEWVSIGGEQRSWFVQGQTASEGARLIVERVHRAFEAFYELARLLSAKS